MSLYLMEKLNCAKKFYLDFSIHASNISVLVDIVWRAINQICVSGHYFLSVFTIYALI